MVDAADWSDYLERFLAEHAGITERILSRCRSDGINPYEWCAEPLAGRPDPVVDMPVEAVQWPITSVDGSAPTARPPSWRPRGPQGGNP